MKPRVFVTNRMPESGMEILKKECEVIYREKDEPIPHEEFLKSVAETKPHAIFCHLTAKVTKEIIDASPELRVISTMTAGTDHIDVAYATSKGIYVTNSPVAPEPVADVAMGLLLAVARRIVEGDKYIREGKWKIAWTPFMMLGWELKGKTLGIIGLGRIGGAMAKRAKAFDMNVIYYDIVRNQKLEQELGVKFVSLEELLRTSDFVSIHTFLSKDTYHMINEERLRMMKKNAILINTSRGPVVDEKALIKALKEGWIAGAGLDVFEVEPLPMDSPLLKLPNVVVTPHIGNATYEARYAMAETGALNIVKVLKGEQPISLFNPDVMKVRPLDKVKVI
ncbi:MAG: D-glycerate dehydrogenase [Candidatus Terraquivivens tikiterensis]|uniref:D-glycerate dehydrogenase n=1 Tax=Candidatus Terraquivivens tikiterensis TaxID=1980982 RepID=A0A2R7Y320_9ARCH|nr:MAG: D-glycerate dehydrogenase [Candidatus Terraquivivens tikiterensis]